MKDRSDWMLCPEVFMKVDQLTGPLQVDLFASQLTYQLQEYLSWRPDPHAMATDAFTLDWTRFQGYANPPWNMMGRVLTHVRHQKARLVLVAPVWRSQTWYPVLLEMVTWRPLLLPNKPNLIQPTHRVNRPVTTPQLAVWAILGTDSEAKRFWKRLKNSSWPHGDRNRQRPMTPCSKSGWAGAVKGVLIPFQEI